MNLSIKELNKEELNNEELSKEILNKETLNNELLDKKIEEGIKKIEKLKQEKNPNFNMKEFLKQQEIQDEIQKEEFNNFMKEINNDNYEINNDNNKIKDDNNEIKDDNNEKLEKIKELNKELKMKSIIELYNKLNNKLEKEEDLNLIKKNLIELKKDIKSSIKEFNNNTNFKEIKKLEEENSLISSINIILKKLENKLRLLEEKKLEELRKINKDVMNCYKCEKELIEEDYDYVKCDDCFKKSCIKCLEDANFDMIVVELSQNDNINVMDDYELIDKDFVKSSKIKIFKCCYDVYFNMTSLKIDYEIKPKFNQQQEHMIINDNKKELNEEVQDKKQVNEEVKDKKELENKKE